MSDRIKELTEMGEFKTHSEAIEYCRLHGINELHFDKYAFTIAGALMDARKEQDKITVPLHNIVNGFINNPTDCIEIDKYKEEFKEYYRSKRMNQ